MPDRLIDTMSHELGRWSYMNDRQLQFRISKMRKLDKLFCCYVVASEQGRDNFMAQVENMIVRLSGRQLNYFSSSIREAANIYRELNTDRPSMSQVRPAEDSILPLPGDGTVPADFAYRYETDPLTGKHRVRVDKHGRPTLRGDSHPLAFPPEPDHDTETCECAMCKSLRKAKHQRAVSALIHELEREIRKLDEPDTTLRRRIRFKRRSIKFRDGWTQPTLGGE